MNDVSDPDANEFAAERHSIPWPPIGVPTHKLHTSHMLLPRVFRSLIDNEDDSNHASEEGDIVFHPLLHVPGPGPPMSRHILRVYTNEGEEAKLDRTRETTREPRKKRQGTH